VAFVNDLVTQEDRKRFDYINIFTPWGRPIRVVTLTMDRDRMAYLARIYMDREPPHDEKFVFWWRRRSAHFTVNMTEEKPLASNGLVAVFRELRLPKELEVERDTVLEMIKEALSVHNSAGRHVPVWLRIDKSTLV
jgi:hypothetical protein